MEDEKNTTNGRGRETNRRGKRNGRRRYGNTGFEEWGGYMEAKKRKLADQFGKQAANESGTQDCQSSELFSGVAIFVNGYTVPPADELKRLMMTHGGLYHHYYRPQHTTHIIATNLPHVKIAQLKNEKVVKPEWLVACVKENRLIDFKLYQLYTNQDQKQQPLPFRLEPKENVTVSESTNDENFAGNNSSSDSDIEDVTLSSNNTEIDTDNVKCGSIVRAGEANFLSEFYNHSRLHHISTMGAMLKQHVNQLRENSDGVFPGRERLKQFLNSSDQTKDSETTLKDPIMHIDIDCFFVSVGLQRLPELVGLPVAVTHSKGNPVSQNTGTNKVQEIQLYRKRWKEKNMKNQDDLSSNDEDDVSTKLGWLSTIDEKSSMSEVASCSYEARQAGVKNGMLLGAALKLCPNLKTISYDFDGYKEVSLKLYSIVASYTLDIEAVSCDEMFVKCSDILKESRATPLQFAQFLREEIKECTGCNASAGLGPNILLARLATRKAKPNGQYLVTPEQVEEFMRTQSVTDIPGVGYALRHRLESMSLNTCQDLQQMALGTLQKEFGEKTGESLYKYCRGVDQRQLSTHHERKSVSAEVNYGIRFQSSDEADKFLEELSVEVNKRMEEINVKGKTITLKLKVRAKEAPVQTAKFMGHGVCDNISKSTTITMATSDPKVIHREVISMLHCLKVPHSELRGIGIQVSRLTAMNTSTKEAQRGLRDFLKTKPPDKILSPARSNSSKSVQSETVTTLNQPIVSPPMLDEEVLAALPPELRKEIEDEYNSVRMVPAAGPSRYVAGPSGYVAGPSGYDAGRSDQTIERTEDKSKSSLDWKDETESTSFSQIDPDFLYALPVHLRQEIRHEFASRKRAAKQPVSKNSKSPQKLFGTKKGRPKKKSPIKKKSPVKRIQGQATLYDFNVENKPSDVTVEKSPIKVSPQPQLELRPTPTFCGQSDVDTVRELVKNWVDSTQNPLEEDEKMIGKYFQQLVENEELEILYALVKSLHRFISKQVYDSSLWKVTYKNLSDRIQILMKKQFDMELKIPQLV